MKKFFAMLAITTMVAFSTFSYAQEETATEPVVEPVVVEESTTPVDSFSLSDALKKLPALKQGIMFNAIDNEVNYLSTAEVANLSQMDVPKFIKGLSFEVGYSSTDAAVGVVSYSIVKLKDLGVTIPVLDLVDFNVGVAIGYSRIAIGPGNAKDNNEFIWGPTVTLLSAKW